MPILTLEEIDDILRDVSTNIRVNEHGTIHPDDLRVLDLAVTAKDALKKSSPQPGEHRPVKFADPFGRGTRWVCPICRDSEEPGMPHIWPCPVEMKAW